MKEWLVFEASGYKWKIVGYVCTNGRKCDGRCASDYVYGCVYNCMCNQNASVISSRCTYKRERIVTIFVIEIVAELFVGELSFPNVEISMDKAGHVHQ